MFPHTLIQAKANQFPQEGVQQDAASETERHDWSHAGLHQGGRTTSSNHYEFYYLIEQQALLIKALFATYVGLYPWLHWGAFLFGSYWPKLSNCSKFLLLFNQIYS